MLQSYITQTQRLLQNPGAPVTLYSQSDIISYINIARGQLAGEARCIRVLGALSTVAGQRNYNFSSIVVATGGIGGVLHVRAIRYVAAQGFRWVAPRPWTWFDFYHLNNPTPGMGPPRVWAQYAQGSSGTGALPGSGAGALSSGSFFIDPVPDQVYGLICDCACYPGPLNADTDPEPIPYLWTDAVPFYAAYYALLSSQTSARMADAERYYEYYTQFVQRARVASTPDVNRYLYEQVPDPTALNQMALPSGGRGAAAQG